MSRLYALDNRINWAAVAGALCAWDIYAKRVGRPSASTLIRDRQHVALLFLLALTVHLTRKDLRHA